MKKIALFLLILTSCGIPQSCYTHDDGCETCRWATKQYTDCGEGFQVWYYFESGRIDTIHYKIKSSTKVK